MEEITVSKFAEALGLGSWYRKDATLLTPPRFWDFIETTQNTRRDIRL